MKMSRMRNFRVSVNLCLWFHDHRQKAKIFINDDIQTVGDLEKRIKNIFKIKHFYLTAHDEYLPPSEDVRILQNDDIVWVMKTSHKEVTPPKIPTEKINNTTKVVESKKRSVTEDYLDEDRPLRKKKKKKHDSEENIAEEEVLYPSKEKPKKKRKHNVNKDCDTINNDLTTTMENDTNKMKDEMIKTKLNCDGNNSEMNTLNDETSLQNKSSTMNINKLLPVLQNHIKSYNKKNNRMNKMEVSSTTSSDSQSSTSISTHSDSQSEQCNDSRTLYSKNTLASYKKKVSIPTITDKYLKERKVNIVKIEYLSGGPEQLKELEITGKNLDTQNENGDNIICEDIPKNNDNSVEDETGRDGGINTLNQNLIVCEHPVKMSIGNEENALESKWEKMEINPIIISENNLKDSEEKMDNEASNEEEIKKHILDKSKSLLSTFNEKLNCKQLYRSHKSTDTSAENDSPLGDPEITKEITGASDVGDNLPMKQTSIVESEFISKPSNTPCNKIGFSFTQPMETCEPGTSVTAPEPILHCEQISQPEEKVENCVLENRENHLNNTQNGDTSMANNKPEGRKVSHKNILSCTAVSNAVSFLSKENLTDQNIVNETNLCDNINDSELESTKEVSRSLDRLSNDSVDTRANSSFFSKRKRLSGLGQLLDELRSNESLVTGESMDSDYSEFITKRRRKRVRRKKKKSNEINPSYSLNDSSIAITADYKPKAVKTRACPTIHLKFEEDEGQPLKVIDLTKKSSFQEENESHPSTSCIENITIESEEEGKSENFNIQEEHIFKSPSIKNLLPKIGDIIAFKILRITENYTPEISSYIIGKVEEFNADTKVVLYDILNGIEQCEDPKGKLSINVGHDNDNCKREFLWTEIIDPRLLFP